MSDDRWRDTYDEWKLRSPYDDERPADGQDFEEASRDIYPPQPEKLCAFKCRMVIERLQFRIDAMREKGLEGVSISLGFAAEIVATARAAADMLEPPTVGPDESKPMPPDEEPVF
jgi:hypothetical protein